MTIIDLERRVPLGEVQVGVEPEGMGISPDGKLLVNTSETTNMAHFIDTATREIVANVLVDARPRYAEFKQRRFRGLGVVRNRRHRQRDRSGEARGQEEDRRSRSPGMRKEAIQPVGIGITRDGKTGFVALGPANRVAVIDATTLQGAEISAGRAAGLADGVHARREISADRHQWRIERRLGDRRRDAQRVIKTIQVGELPWGVAISQQ